MLSAAREIIGTQPILAAFLAIGVGYLVGQINIGGFSLGVGAVLFVGLAIGAFAPKSQIIGTDRPHRPDHVPLRHRHSLRPAVLRRHDRRGGRKYNLLALVAVVAGLLVALGLGQVFGIKIGHTLGIFAGSMTSTATLQAALDVMSNKDPSIGYSIAYPFGVIGPILCIYFMTRQVQPKFPPKAQRFHMGEITLGESCAGQTLDELAKDLPDGVQVTMVRKGDQNFVPSNDHRAGRRRRPADRRRQPGGDRRGGRTRSGSWSRAASSRIARRSTTSASSSARPTWSAFRSRSCRCRPAFRCICCMCGATTWTSFRRPI